VALKVLAHFVPGDKVLELLAPEADWLDIRWCADDDSAAAQAHFYRELPDAEVIWHVLRPLSGADLRRGVRLRLVQKLGAGVNTIDVQTATNCGIAVANMPGANAPSVAEGAVLLMLAALRRLPALDRDVREGRGGRRIQIWARRFAISAAAPSVWSAGQYRQTGGRHRRRDGRLRAAHQHPR